MEMTMEEVLRLLDALKDEEQHQLPQTRKRRDRFADEFKDW